MTGRTEEISRVGYWAICVGVLMASLGMLGAYLPEEFVAVVQFFQAPPMIYAAALIRVAVGILLWFCLLYTSPSPRDGLLSRMPSSA